MDHEAYLFVIFALAACASETDCLEETPPYSPREIGWRYFIFFAVCANLIFGTIGFCVGWSNEGLVGAFVGLLVANCVLLPMVAMFALMSGYVYALARPSIAVKGGRLMWRQGDAKTTTYLLADCEWFIGSAGCMAVRGNITLPFKTALVVTLWQGLA